MAEIGRVGQGTKLSDAVKLSYLLLEPPDAFGSFGEFTEALRRVKQLGYQGVELHLVDPPGFEVEALADFVESIRLPVVSFLSGQNFVRDGLNLSSPRAEVRQRAIERLGFCTKVASRFGAVVILGQMLGLLGEEPSVSTGEARIEESLKPVVEAAERHGTTIGLEPLNIAEGGFFNTLRDVIALTDRLGSRRFEPMLDTHHMFKNPEERSMTGPIRQVGSHLAHVHLCETNGGPFGAGALDFRAIFQAFQAIKYPGWVSVKVYDRPWPIAAEESMRFLCAQNL